MADIKDIAQGYIDRGFAVVPVTKGKKKASTSWRKRTYQASDFSPGDNIAIKCGAPSGNLIDFDCDCPEAIEVARLMMPTTPMRHGRPGKPDSHYWFRSDTEMRSVQFTDITGGMLLELRSTGGYTVVPPSLWSDKHGLLPDETLAWVEADDPAKVSATIAYDMAAQMACATLCAIHYPGPGARHASTGPLVGLFCHAGIESQQAVRLALVAARVGGDTDLADREKFARATAAKFDAGQPVTGGPSLSEFFPEAVVARLRAWLRVADVDALEAMNAKHFWVRLGKDDCIGREDTASGAPVFQRVRALYSEYANVKIQTGVDKDGDAIIKPLFPEWLEWPARRKYREVTFSPPPRPADPQDYNLWTGFAIQPADVDAPEKLCERILDHLYEVICAGNEEHYHYLMKMLALLVQCPGIPWEVALVMRGQRGTGKGTFMRLMKRLIGHLHFAHLDRVQDLVHFNAMISGKVVVFADEAFFAGDKREVGPLQRIITEPTIRVTRKGIDSTEEPNCIHLCMATNEKWSIPAGDNERRYFAVNVSSKRRGDRAWFNAIEAEVKGDGAAAFFQLLLSVPVTHEDVRNVPHTRELTRQQLLTMDVQHRWWYSCLYEGKVNVVVLGTRTAHEPWATKFDTDDMFQSYLDYAREQGARRFCDKTELAQEMGEYFTSRTSKPITVVTNGKRCWQLRTLTDARETFNRILGMDCEWPIADAKQMALPEDEQVA